MEKFGNYDKITTASYTALSAGAYPIKIMAAQVKEYPTRDGGKVQKFEIAFDICDGEYKDFFKDDFDSNTHEDKKWRGVLRLYLPKDDGTEKDEWTKKIFKRTIEAIEDSNNGYHWDWEEKKLKGKVAACIFRDEEWEFNGKSGVKAQPYQFISMDKYKNGKYKVPAVKQINGGSNVSTATSAPSTVDLSSVETEEDLPF